MQAVNAKKLAQAILEASKNNQRTWRDKDFEVCNSSETGFEGSMRAQAIKIAKEKQDREARDGKPHQTTSLGTFSVAVGYEQ